MKPPKQSIVTSILLIVFYCCFIVNSEQLSTVFVLETSDSSQSDPNEGNTKIITDNTPTLQTTNNNKQNHKPVNNSNHHHKQDEYSMDEVTRRIDEDPSHQQHTSNAQQNNKQSSNSSKQTSQPTESKHNHSNHDKHQKPVTRNTHSIPSSPPPAQHNGASKPQQKQHTSSQPERTKALAEHHNPDQDHGSYAPQRPTSRPTKPLEERLLISITNESDEEEGLNVESSNGNNKQPKRNVLTPGGHDSSSTDASVHKKRKPSITISIQGDATIGKHDGSNGNADGHSAVIVRPSENGQSIVISTVGGGKHQIQNGQKPAIIIGGNNNNQNNQNHNEDVPISPGIVQYSSTTTRRPSTAPGHSNGEHGKPLVSTLLEPTTMREDGAIPYRPTSDEASYDQKPVTSRPINRPLQHDQPSSDINSHSESSNSQAQDYQPTEAPVKQTTTPAPKFPLNERNCGLVHETRIVGGEEANPDDFLWMAAIIKSKPTDSEARPFCGGSLITRRHILTAAHCLENLAPRDVLVRLGSYDFDDATASSLSADYAIDQFRVPAHYSKKTHVADIAIMRLKTPLSLTDNYKTVCMPQARRSYVGALGTVTGYGSQSHSFRKAAPKLRQVTVPIWENRKCSGVYKKNLTESYLCAGYEEGGKDACQGDSGGPLMTEGPSERMMVVGVVSHGIGCGSPGYPGVYTRTTTYLDWIEKNTKE